MRSLWFEKEEGSVKSLVVRVEGSLHQNCLGVSSRVHIAFLLTIVVTRVTCMFVLLLGRPNVSSGGICFSRDVFLLSVYLFFSPRVLRGSSTDRPETLPHGRNLAEFYNPLQKFEGGGRSPRKIRVPQTWKISVNFVPLQTLIANISGTRQHLKFGLKFIRWASIISGLVGISSTKFSRRRGELWSTNEKCIGANIDTPELLVHCKMTQFHLPSGSRVRFSGLFGRWRCCERNFEYLYWQSTRTCGTGRPHVGLCRALLVS